MAITDPKKANVTEEGVQNALLNLFSPKTDFDVRVPVDIDVDARQDLRFNLDQRQWQDQRIYSPVDSRQLVLNLNSPGATTKKEDKVSGPEIAGSLENSSRIPLDVSGPTTPIDVSPDIIPSLDTGGSLVTILLIGGLGYGAYVMLKDKKKK
jgi:hypothetical protein